MMLFSTISAAAMGRFRSTSSCRCRRALTRVPCKVPPRGVGRAEGAWDARMRSRQDAIRQRYLDYAAELQRSGTARDDALARQIRQFVKDMPAVETRRLVLKKELSELADSRRRGAEQGVYADKRGNTRGDERSK